MTTPFAFPPDNDPATQFARGARDRAQIGPIFGVVLKVVQMPDGSERIIAVQFVSPDDVRDMAAAVLDTPEIIDNLERKPE